MNPLSCPFCGAAAVARMDGPDCRPFSVRCSEPACPAADSQGCAAPEVAMRRWNMRAPAPSSPTHPVADVWGFTKKNLIRGEMVCLTLDQSGVFQSEAISFSKHSKPLMLRP